MKGSHSLQAPDPAHPLSPHAVKGHPVPCPPSPRAERSPCPLPLKHAELACCTARPGGHCSHQQGQPCVPPKWPPDAAPSLREMSLHSGRGTDPPWPGMTAHGHAARRAALGGRPLPPRSERAARGRVLSIPGARPAAGSSAAARFTALFPVAASSSGMTNGDCRAPAGDVTLRGAGGGGGAEHAGQGTSGRGGPGCPGPAVPALTAALGASTSGQHRLPQAPGAPPSAEGAF